MPLIFASETRAAIATVPTDALATSGAAVDVVVAWTSTSCPLAVSVEPVTYDSVVVWIVRSDFAPAPERPARLIVIAAATLLVVIDGLELDVTSMLPPLAFTDEPSMYADTVSPTVLVVSETAAEAPASRLPDRLAATMVAEMVGVSPAVTLTAPEACTGGVVALVESLMYELMCVVMVLVALAPAPLTATLVRSAEIAVDTAAATAVAVMCAVSSASSFRSPARAFTLVSAFWT